MSTFAAGVAPAMLVGWVSGFGLKMPAPVVGQRVAPLPEQVITRVATPGFENGFDIQTVAAAPWNRPAPPRICVCRARSNL